MKSRALYLLAAAAFAAGTFWIGTRQQPSPAQASTPATGVAAQRPDLSAVLAETDPLRHRTLFLQWLDGLTPAEFAAAADKIWSLPGDTEEIAERKKLFCYAWGRTDGAAALEYARMHPGAAKIAAIGSALAGWAGKDPETAKSWIAARLEPAEQLMYSWALVEGWARKDPAAATAYALSMKDLPNAGRFMQTIALEQTRRDPATAGQWALTLPEASLRGAAVETVAATWSRSAPRAAAQWAATLTDRTLAIPALKNAVTEWARVDDASAGDWLNTLPRTALRDEAVSAYCEVIGTRGLTAVSQWAATIHDSGAKEQCLRRIAEEWLGRNPEAARAWLPSSGLSAAAQAEIARE